MKLYDKWPTDSTGGQGRGHGNIVAMARQIGGLFRLDVKVAGKLY
jgi:hypothetical protein